MTAMHDDPLNGDVQVLRNQPASYAGNYRILFDLDLTTRTLLIHDVLRRSTTTYRC